MRVFDEKLKNNIRRYVFQCLLATVTILIILLFLNIFTHTTIIASLGATTFIVFAMPNNPTAKPRNLIGGYLTGIVIGSLSSLLVESVLSNLMINGYITYIIFGAVAVGLTILIMVIIDTEHPPAVGLALGLVLGSWNFKIIIILFLAVVLMSIAKYLLRDILIDLK